MKQQKSRNSRRQVGEEVVSVIVRQALLAGATIEQLESRTGRKRSELQRLLARLDALEEMTREIDRDE